MSELIEFPGREPPPEGYSEHYVDKLHAEAFRDLEGRISDCQCMAKIAAQLMSNATTMDSELVFAVFNTSQILKALMADYQGRLRAAGSTPATRCWRAIVATARRAAVRWLCRLKLLGDRRAGFVAAMISD